VDTDRHDVEPDRHTQLDDGMRQTLERIATVAEGRS
jgi:hypothetical protein